MLVDEIMSSNDIVKTLLRLEFLQDRNTYNHSIGVAKLTEKLLEKFEKKYAVVYSAKERKEILIAVLLHDIGKIFVPFNLTSSTDKFSKDSLEKSIIDGHSAVGALMVSTLVSQIIYDIILYHHKPEDCHGQNYKVTSALFLVHIADIYNALTTNRPYRNINTPKEAIEKIRENNESIYCDILEEEIEEEQLLYNTNC